MGFSGQEYWSGLPFPPPRDLQIKPRPPTLWAGSLPFELQGKPKTGFSPLDHQGSPYCLNVASPNWVKIQNSNWISKINMKITNETSIKSTYYLFNYLDIILNESKSAPCLKLATKTLRMDCYS